MSEAPSPIDRDAEMLARLAELDLSAAEHVHAQLVAAVDAAEIADLGRSYQRLSRSLRQTLALKAKLVRERSVAAAHAALERRVTDPSFEGFRVDDRTLELQDAVARMAHAACPGDEERRERLLDRFDAELDDWACEEDFADADLDAQVRRACRLLDLPEELASRWRSLPPPVYDPEADARYLSAAAEPPQPRSSSA